MGEVIKGVHGEFRVYGPWMAWNLILAIIPWLLAVPLFQSSRRPKVCWWLAAITCLVFLPNAAYVLTDVVHLPAAVRDAPGAIVLIGVLPLFGALFLVGFGLYADTLRRVSRYSVARGWAGHGWPLELGIHALSAVAIYAGRVHRFNSWDLVRQPVSVLTHTLGGLTRPLPVVGISVTFVALAVGYLATRPVLDAAYREGAGVAARLRAPFWAWRGRA